MQAKDIWQPYHILHIWPSYSLIAPCHWQGLASVGNHSHQSLVEMLDIIIGCDNSTNEKAWKHLCTSWNEMLNMDCLIHLKIVFHKELDLQRVGDTPSNHYPSRYTGTYNYLLQVDSILMWGIWIKGINTVMTFEPVKVAWKYFMEHRHIVCNNLPMDSGVVAMQTLDPLAILYCKW